MSRITLGDLNDRQREMIPSDVRASMGAAAMTSSEAQHRYARQQEKKMHEQFEQWLGHHADRLYWDHSRMDKQTTNRKGHPDFVIQGAGKVLNIEFKVPGGVLSEDQKMVHAWLTKAGNQPLVCFDVARAIDAVRKEFGV